MHHYIDREFKNDGGSRFLACVVVGLCLENIVSVSVSMESSMLQSTISEYLYICAWLVFLKSSLEKSIDLRLEQAISERENESQHEVYDATSNFLDWIARAHSA